MWPLKYIPVHCRCGLLAVFRQSDVGNISVLFQTFLGGARLCVLKKFNSLSVPLDTSSLHACFRLRCWLLAVVMFFTVPGAFLMKMGEAMLQRRNLLVYGTSFPPSWSLLRAPVFWFVLFIYCGLVFGHFLFHHFCQLFGHLFHIFIFVHESILQFLNFIRDSSDSNCTCGVPECFMRVQAIDYVSYLYPFSWNERVFSLNIRPRMLRCVLKYSSVVLFYVNFALLAM